MTAKERAFTLGRWGDWFDGPVALASDQRARARAQI
jgi:hypothetical protein